MTSHRILVVDDEAGMLRSVERVLGQDYKLATTRSSKAAVELAAEFKPELAILDIQMPEMDGFQLMEKLRALDSHLKVIFMTGSVHELDAKLIHAVRTDAFYFLHKPFDRGVLLALVERALELKRLETTNREHLIRLERELNDARAFQQSLLPSRSGNIGSISVFVHYIPYHELAGDFYDYVAIPPDGAVMLVADVSGHGASAAMLTGTVKSALHSASSDGYEPASVVDKVATGIRQFGCNHFITLICIRVRGESLEFVNAGHPPGILSTAENTGAVLSPTGPIISPAFSFSWQQETLKIRREHGRVVLFTDAIIEAESETGSYGLDRLVEEVSGGPTEASALAARILQSVQAFGGGRPVNDDLTLLVADL
jgi:phosphoserine phosphatase RsbU/P